MNHAISRRAVLKAAGALAAAAAIPGCRRVGGPGGSVVLYTSTDSYLLPEILGPFEAASGIRVRVVGDTEATKTFGLVQRLLRERERPAADVWWSNEVMSTVSLAEAGVLAPLDGFASPDFGTWPAALTGRDNLWHGFSLRARCFVVDPRRVSAPPRTLRELTDERYRGRVGLARPQFGTTRTHIASLVAAFGEENTARWMEAMLANGVRLYDGNSAVVKAAEHAEIDIGLTDTDDVLAVRRNGSPVELVLERRDDPAELHNGLPSRGPLVIPNTAALVRGGPNPAAARTLVEYLLSAQVERLLAASDSRNTPIRPALAEETAREFGTIEMDAEAWVDFSAAAAAATVADRLIATFFPIG